MNTHSLIEDNYFQKLEYFVDAIQIEKPNIIALQEVNQSIKSQEVSKNCLINYIPCQSNVTIKKDNHAYSVINMLHSLGIDYYWTYLPIKIGYKDFQEGLAFLSLNPIVDTKTFLISNINDIYNWRTRKCLGIKVSNNNDWFYNTHMSWWNDIDEPFENQWNVLQRSIQNGSGIAWLMGDFNNPAEIENEGYSLMLKSGWLDTYNLSKSKDIGFTVEKLIDGWKDKLSKSTGMRIDQIWCNHRINIESSKVIFNGENGEIVSDHYGVIISTD